MTVGREIRKEADRNIKGHLRDLVPADCFQELTLGLPHLACELTFNRNLTFNIQQAMWKIKDALGIISQLLELTTQCFDHFTPKTSLRPSCSSDHADFSMYLGLLFPYIFHEKAINRNAIIFFLLVHQANTLY